ncbi:MAG: nucleotidyltransferase domain-containing protein [Mariprofundales bacterium]
MRLASHEVQMIKQVVAQVFGVARVWLFGSRVDDQARGGDVDLYVEVDRPSTLQERLRAMTQIQMAMGGRKVDLLVRDAGRPEQRIHHIAKASGVLL